MKADIDEWLVSVVMVVDEGVVHEGRTNCPLRQVPQTSALGQTPPPTFDVKLTETTFKNVS